MKVEIEMTALPLVGKADAGESAWLVKLSGLALIVERKELKNHPLAKAMWGVRSNVDLGDQEYTLEKAILSYCEIAERHNRSGLGFQATLLKVIVPVLRREASFIDNILGLWNWNCDKVTLTTPLPTEQ